MNSMPTTLFVTAFVDVGRPTWKTYARSEEFYFEAFGRLCRLKNDLMVYIESKYLSMVLEIIQKNRPEGVKTFIRPIYIIREQRHKSSPWKDAYVDYRITCIESSNIKTLLGSVIRPNAFAVLPKAQEVMASESYRRLVSSRSDNPPEVLSPQYNAINHAKCELVSAAANLTLQYKFYAWIDFGYCRSEDCLPDGLEYAPIPAFLDGRVHLLTIDGAREEYSDPVEVLQTGAVRVTGPFWGGTFGAVQRFSEQYTATHQSLLESGIEDDDQSVMLQLIQHHPELVRTWLMNDSSPLSWFVALRDYNCLPFNDRSAWHRSMNGYLGTYVEIGVDRGTFLDYVIKRSGFTALYGVDPYRNLSGYMDSINGRSPEEFQRTYLAARNLENTNAAHVRIFRELGHEAVTRFAPGSLDFVYIDGDHSYRGALRDMETWWPMIRPGGVLAGDDLVDDLSKPYDADSNQHIEWSPGCWGHYGVNLALKHFEGVLNLTKTIQAVRFESAKQWMIVKPYNDYP